MDRPRPCGCKGRRTCLSCEEEFGLQHNDTDDIRERVAPHPSRQSYSDKSAEERISYCTGPPETRADFDFSDCRFSLSNVDVRSDVSDDKSSSAPVKCTSRTLSTLVNDKTDSQPRALKDDLFPSNLVKPVFRGGSETVFGCGRDTKVNQPHSSRYHTRQPSKHDSFLNRHRKASNRGSFEASNDGADASDVDMEFTQKLHRIHHPKTTFGLERAPTARRGIGRVGVQVSINDCVCIASSADLGTARDSNIDLGNKRHVHTWASRIPPEPTELHESDSGSQVDILSSPSHPQENPHNCICQPLPPQSAADYYHSMPSRQSFPAEPEQDRQHPVVSQGGRSSLSENQQGTTQSVRVNKTSAGKTVGSPMVRQQTAGVFPSRSRKKRRSSIRDWNEPHKLYPDLLRWGGERPFRWEDNLRNTDTNALLAVHPQRWMPVGKQQYTHHHGYPSWPERDKSYVYCPWCQKAWPGWDISEYQFHPNHEGSPIDYPGIFIEMDWLTEEEEVRLVSGMDEMSWDISQSGRRKQNFGPKCNFKKRKMKLGDFNGFPAFSKFVQDKFRAVPILEGYLTIEQCSLEYDPSKGASIDRHIDDCWVWGERIVTVNLLSDSVLTMTPYCGEKWRYNLPLVSTYDPVLNNSGALINNQIKSLAGGKTTVADTRSILSSAHSSTTPKDVVVRVPMPRRSLLVIFGPPRYDWEHRVLREDVKERRLCLAYREFTPPYLPGGGLFHESEEILQVSSNFWDHSRFTPNEQVVS